ncbi:MAG: N-6 DNA methylase [Saprospiraceae bacterium]|nr:N-6 DNA methylase [Saprospiraceae bacterium]
MDYWYLFLHKAYFLTKESGVNTFITPSYWITAQGGKKIRKRIIENYYIVEYINFNENSIFAAGVHTNIFLLKKNKNKNTNIKCKIYQNKHTDNIFLYRNSELVFFTDQNKIFNNWTGFVHFLPSGILSIINQLYKNCEKLSDNESEGQNKIPSVAGKKITNGICNINQGIITGKDRLKEKSSNLNQGVYIITKSELNDINFSKKELEYIKPFVKNSDIKKYTVDKELDYFIIYVDDIETDIEFNELINIKNHLSKFKESLSKRFINGVLQSAYKKGKWWALIHSVPINTIKNPKIICPQRNRYNLFAIDEGETYASADVYYISPNRSGYSLKYILPILNSRVVYFWLYWMGKRKGEMLELYFEPLQFIPIKKCSGIIQNNFIKKTDEIILLKSESKDTIALERQIDNLVYKLYELTYDEVLVVEPEFGDRMSREEYDALVIE